VAVPRSKVRSGPRSVRQAVTTPPPVRPVPDYVEAQRETSRRALVGATALVDLGAQVGTWKNWKFGNVEWQAEGWRLYDIVPEHRFLANWIGDSVAQARLYVTEVSETGEETGEVEDETISGMAAVPLGTGSQRDDNLRLAGVDVAVAGECWIVGEGAAIGDPRKARGNWFVVTSAALKREGGTTKVRRPQTHGGGWLSLVDGRDILTRCWRPHPNDVDQADSPTRPALVPLREIELLTKREFAELDSRLTGAGMWFLPEGIDFPRQENDPAGIAGFMAYAQRAVTQSITDQASAAAMVPYMATLPDSMWEHAEKLKDTLVNFWSPLSDNILPMKADAVKRVAKSFEIPNETVEGMSTANHWTAWAISEDGIKRIKSYLSYIADALTRGFLRPALKRMGVKDPDRYAFAFDTAPLAARPNRLEDAITLHDRFLMTDEEVVKAGAFSPEQMPTNPERVKMLLTKLVQSQPDLLLDPAIQLVLGLPRIMSVGLPATSDQNTDGDRPPADDDEDEADGPPNDGDADGPPVTESSALMARLDGRILELSAAPPTPERIFNASAKLMIYRALELAGGRLTTPQERRGRWADVPRHELHARVGPITPDKALKVTEGAWTHIPAVAGDLGVDAEDLGRLLSGYCHELLTRGMAHHDDLLYAALVVANRGRGLAEISQ